MIANGHLERKGISLNGRVMSLRITEDGRKALGHARAASNRAEQPFLAGLPVADRRKILKMLSGIVEHAKMS